jgi:arylsulfatase A-like enzyme
MKRKVLLLVAAIVVPVAVAVSFILHHAPRQKPALSFVVITVDSLRADHLASYGYRRRTAPRIEALAREGFVFDSAFSQAPWTKPSVASLFTSVYIAVHDVLYTKRVAGESARSSVLSPKFLTLAEALHSHGFATGGFGHKMHLRPEFGFAQGFDGYDMDKDHADEVTLAAVKWLRHDDPDRFFLYMHYDDTHYPYDPPMASRTFTTHEPRMRLTGDVRKAFRAKKVTLTAADIEEQVDLYDDAILYTDAYIGRLLDSIRDMGYGNLLVVLIGDHGEEFLDHGDITHDQSLYDELVHVPLIVGGSGLPTAARGRRYPGPAQLIDIMPTILDVAGLPRPPGLQGRSLKNALAGTPGDPPGTLVFSQRRDITDKDFSVMVSDGRWKLIETPETGGVALYDRLADPREKSPVSDPPPALLDTLTRRIEEWKATNRSLHDSIGPETTTPLTPEAEEQLRSLGYID